MSVPKSVIRFKKGNVVLTSSVDYYKYTIRELTRAALRDVGKLLCRRTNQKAQTLPGMKQNRRVRGSRGAFQYWARARECDLLVGIKHGTWYGTEQELGSSKMPKKGFLTSTAYESVAEIIAIESAYLTGVPNGPVGTSEGDYQGGGDD